MVIGYISLIEKRLAHKWGFHGCLVTHIPRTPVLYKHVQTSKWLEWICGTLNHNQGFAWSSQVMSQLAPRQEQLHWFRGCRCLDGCCRFDFLLPLWNTQNELNSPYFSSHVCFWWDLQNPYRILLPLLEPNTDTDCVWQWHQLIYNLNHANFFPVAMEPWESHFVVLRLRSSFGICAAAANQKKTEWVATSNIATSMASWNIAIRKIHRHQAERL